MVNPQTAKLGFIDLAIFLGGLIVSFVGALELLVALMNPEALSKATPEPGRGDPMVLLALLAALFGAAVPAVALAVIRHGRQAPTLLGLHQAGGRWLWLATIAVLVLAMIVDQGVLRLVRAVAGSEVVPSASAVIAEIATSAGRTALLVLVAGLLGPLVEELVFRGLLYGYVEGRFGGMAALIVSSLAFAAAHVEPIHVALVLPIGVLLGWTRMRTGSLWPAIAAHVANNTVAVLATYLLR